MLSHRQLREKRTLIDKARDTKADVREKRTKHPEGQLVELATAWLRGEIGNAQIATALGAKPHSIASCIRTIMNALRRSVIANGRGAVASEGCRHLNHLGQCPFCAKSEIYR